MAKNFMDVRHAIISTLSPVHLGCGEDYQPTNYVMEGQILYHFDPVTALMGNELARQELMGIVDQVGGQDGMNKRIQAFFYKWKDPLMAAHSHRVRVAEGVQNFYNARINPSLGRDKNKREIQRTAFVAAQDRVFMPGSGLKGAIRTALLDGVHNDRPLRNPRDAESRKDWKEIAPIPQTLEGYISKNFEMDPMRLIRIGDANPLDFRNTCDIFFALNLKRSGEPGRGPYQLLECISPLSLEAFSCELSRTQPDPKDGFKHTWSLDDVISQSNRYYGPQLLKEVQDLPGLDTEWRKVILNSLRGGALGRLLAGGQAFLLRVGRHSGAESVTLNGARHIKIMQGKEKQPEWRDSPTTMWLAGGRDKQEQNLLPFGWILVELDHDGRRPLAKSVPELAQLTEYFATNQSKLLQDSDALVMRLLQEEKVKKEKAEHLQEAQAQRESQEAEQRARLSQLTVNAQKVEALRENIVACTVPQPVSGALWGAARVLTQEAKNGWSLAERESLVTLCREALLAKVQVNKKKWQELETVLSSLLT